MTAGFSHHIYDATNFRVLFDIYLERAHDYASSICKSDYLAEEVKREALLFELETKKTYPVGFKNRTHFKIDNAEINYDL